MSKPIPKDTEFSVSQQMEIDLGNKYKFVACFDPRRGGNWPKFQKGNIRVWIGGRNGWIRANLIDETYQNHMKHPSLEDALKNINGVNL